MHKLQTEGTYQGQLFCQRRRQGASSSGMVETETGGQVEGTQKGECKCCRWKVLEHRKPCLCHGRPHRFLSTESRNPYGLRHHFGYQPRSLWCLSVNRSYSRLRCEQSFFT